MPFSFGAAETRSHRLRDLLRYAKEIYRPGIPMKPMRVILRAYAEAKWRIARTTAFEYADVVTIVLLDELRQNHLLIEEPMDAEN